MMFLFSITWISLSVSAAFFFSLSLFMVPSPLVLGPWFTRTRNRKSPPSDFSNGGRIVLAWPKMGVWDASLAVGLLSRHHSWRTERHGDE